MSEGHSLLAPSDAERWSRCVGSLLVSRGLPDVDAEYNASGTCSHWLLNWKLNNLNLDLIAWLGQEMTFGAFKFVIDEARLERVQLVVDRVLSEPGQMWSEKLVNTSPVLGVPDQSGHADIIKLDLEGSVEIEGQSYKGVVSVHDFKDGYILVKAKDNLQGLNYGAAALYELDLMAPINAVRFCIHQPKIHHYDEWTYTRAEIEHFSVLIRPVAKLAYDIYHGTVPFDPAQHLNAGEEQCFWCPVRGRCPARAKRMVDMFAPLIDRHEIDNQTLEKLYGQLDEIEQACKDFRLEMTRRALAGERFETQKLVKSKRGARYWVDKVKAEALLNLALPEEKVYHPRQMISPTQAEALLKKGYAPLAKLVDQAPAGYILAPRDDKRDEVVIQQFPIVEQPK